MDPGSIGHLLKISIFRLSNLFRDSTHYHYTYSITIRNTHGKKNKFLLFFLSKYGNGSTKMAHSIKTKALAFYSISLNLWAKSIYVNINQYKIHFT